MQSRRVLVADPLPLFRAGIRGVLARDGYDVVEAGSLDEALSAAAQAAPDVALVDLDLPPSGAVALVRALADRRTHVIVLNLDQDGRSLLETIRAGATGYLPKEVSPDGLLRALRGLEHGEAPVTRGLMTQMIEALHGLDRRERARRQLERLSEREREVLALVAHGARNREIACSLAISEFTVKRHMQNILQKLELASRGAAAAFWRATSEPEEAVGAA